MMYEDKQYVQENVFSSILKYLYARLENQNFFFKLTFLLLT